MNAGLSPAKQAWAPQIFLNYVIRPMEAALNMPLHDTWAENILLGTAAQESRFRDIPQIGGGPALGPFQMEPATHDDIWRNFLTYKPKLSAAIMKLLPEGMDHESWFLLGHPQYACAMARMLYLRAPGGIPQTLEAQAEYYKAHYNTPLGAATAEEYVKNWNDQIGAFPCL